LSPQFIYGAGMFSNICSLGRTQYRRTHSVQFPFDTP
jgi:hypothetical protein